MREWKELSSIFIMKSNVGVDSCGTTGAYGPGSEKPENLLLFSLFTCYSMRGSAILAILDPPSPHPGLTWELA